jgi:hypothetical protein
VFLSSAHKFFSLVLCVGFQKASDLSKMCDVRVAEVVYDPCKAEPATWPPAPAEAAAILFRQKAEKLRCRELNMMKLAECAREIFLVLNDFIAGNHKILQGLLVNLVADAMAVLELHKKIVSDHLKLQMASHAPPTVPTLAIFCVGYEVATTATRSERHLDGAPSYARPRRRRANDTSMAPPSYTRPRRR